MKRLMKILSILLTIVLTLPFYACENNEGQDKAITKLSANDSEIELFVGDSKKLTYTVSPKDTTEKVIITSANNDVVAVVDDVIIAKMKGSTIITIKSESGKYSDTIKVTVVKNFDYSEFESEYSNTLKKAIVSVYYKRYNKNFFGVEKDVNIMSGQGVIIRSDFDSRYFYTSCSIFANTSGSYKFQEWYVIDYNGNKYPITKIKQESNTNIGIGTFTSTKSYPTVKMSKYSPKTGEYVASLYGSPYSSRVSSVETYRLYHKSGLSNKKAGEPIFNVDGEIIGLNMSFGSDTVVAVPSPVLLAFYNKVFNITQSSGNGFTVGVVS